MSACRCKLIRISVALLLISSPLTFVLSLSIRVNVFGILRIVVTL